MTDSGWTPTVDGVVDAFARQGQRGVDLLDRAIAGEDVSFFTRLHTVDELKAYRELVRNRIQEVFNGFRAHD